MMVLLCELELVTACWKVPKARAERTDGLLPAPSTKLWLWVSVAHFCTLCTASLLPSTPSSHLETMLSPSDLWSPFLHCWRSKGGLGLCRGRMTTFLGTFSTFRVQVALHMKQEQLIDFEASHLSGSKQGHRWPRIFSTRTLQALSQDSNSARRVLGCESRRLGGACFLLLSSTHSSIQQTLIEVLSMWPSLLGSACMGLPMGERQTASKGRGVGWMSPNNEESKETRVAGQPENR